MQPPSTKIRPSKVIFRYILASAFVKGDKKHAHVSATLMDVADEEFDVVKEEITYDKDGYSTRTLYTSLAASTWYNHEIHFLSHR